MTPTDRQELTDSLTAFIARADEWWSELDTPNDAVRRLPVAELVHPARCIDRAMIVVDVVLSSYVLPDDLASSLFAMRKKQVALWARIRELASKELQTIRDAQSAIIGGRINGAAERITAAADVDEFLEHTAAALLGHFAEIDEQIRQLGNHQAEVWSAVAVGSA